MKKAATLVAGLLLVTGTVFAEGFSYDFSGTNVKYTQSFYDSKEGTFVTNTGDSDVTVNFKLANENTNVNFKAEFDDKDSVVVELGHKILDGMVEINVAGDLNFTGYTYDSDKKTYSQTQGLKASRNDSVWLKYKPKSVEGLTIGFYPYDLPFKLEVDGLKLENDKNVPGIKVEYNSFAFTFGSRQVKDKADKPTNRFYGQVDYDYKGEGFGFGTSLLFSTQETSDKKWNQEITGKPIKYALHVDANVELTDAIKVDGEFLTGVAAEEGSDNGMAARVKGAYTLSETETPEGTLTTSTYAEVKYTAAKGSVLKQDRTTLEIGAEASLNEISIKPNFKFVSEKDLKDFEGKVTDNSFALGLTLEYSI